MGAPAPIRWTFSTLSRLHEPLAADLARQVFLRPLRSSQPVRELWWATEARRFTLSNQGCDVPAWRWGRGGPRVLLIHGWGGRGLQLAAFAAPLVEAGFEVVAVDLPAHGEAAGRSTSLPELADAVDAVLHQLGKVSAVITHSFGAAATTLALVQGRQRPENLVFIAPPGDLDTVLEQFSELSGFSPAVVERMRRNLERRFAFRWQSVHPYRLAQEIDSRVMVIHDRDDQQMPWSEGYRLSQAWPDAQLVTTEGLGHFRILHDVAVVEQVVGFLKAYPWIAAEAARSARLPALF